MKGITRVISAFISRVFCQFAGLNTYINIIIIIIIIIIIRLMHRKAAQWQR